MAGGPLRASRDPLPGPGPGELLIEVLVCGVCRTDLHVAEGDLPVHRPGVTPGHALTRSARAREPGAASPPARAPRRPNRWTRPSCSRRSAPSCRPPSKRWTAAARWPWRASTSATPRCWTTGATCSRSASSAASRPARVPTRGSSSTSPPGTGCAS
ncbi:alcohol dehydrogenase catalytic domain-containing protein [Umezawaea sp.]|uniref:alcohol dehydrogenase catalytic domain-containing protein n=1 Tax=Umezawaea sp. TaxID=1955258 RepID=UPI002ECFF007